MPLTLFGLAFGVFAATLVPGVLSGDAGEFAYHPLVLGIPHPTGYPFYLLLGHLWVRLIPFGEPAWRVNLFSAFWGALAVAWLVFFLCRALPSRLAALGGALALLVTPHFWRHSTAAAVYSLHAFLIILALERLHAWWQQQKRKEPTTRTAQTFFLAVGLGLTNHLTFGLFLVGLVPGLVALLSAEVRKATTWKAALARSVRLAWPASLAPLLYLYLPLRAAAIVTGPAELVPGLDLAPAVARGLISPFYRPGVEGVFSYVLGRSLLSSFQSGWGEIPRLWWTQVWRPLGPGWLALIVVGGAAIWWWQKKALVSLLATYALSGTLALKYWQDFAFNGEVANVEGHLMTVHVFHAVFLAAGLAVVWTCSQRVRATLGRWLLAGLPLLLLLPQMVAFARQPPSAGRTQSPAIQEYWDEALAHPLPRGAALMAHWGDLTPFWYQQHALGRRPDLVGLFPPSAELAAAWLRAGRALYLSGPIIDWGTDLASRFRLVPDGLLVRVEPRVAQSSPPPSARARFGPGLRLVDVTVPPTWREGERVSLALTWWTEAPVPRDLLLVLRLRDGSGLPVAEWHRRFASLWDPRAQLPAGQEVISRPFVRVPWGISAGVYRLEVEVFDPATGQAWAGRLEDGRPFGVTVRVESAGRPPKGRAEVMKAAGQEADVLAQWVLVQLIGSPLPQGGVYPGQEVPVTLTWVHRGTRARQYAVQFRLEPPGGGESVQAWQVPLALSARWSGTVTDVRRQALRLRLAADVPAGTYRLVATLLGPDGQPEMRRVGLGRRLAVVPLGSVRVAERQRMYELPPTARRLLARFGERVELLGFERRGGDGVVLYWRTRRELPLALTVFVHVLDADGNLVGQADHVPQGGRAPTTGWLPGEVVTDAFTLPVELQPGWRLRVGLYDPVSGARLPLDAGGDAVEIVWGEGDVAP